MAKFKNVLILFVLLCMMSNIFVFATEIEAPKNIEIVQLKLLENNEGVLSVFYGYPIDSDAEKIEHKDLLNEEFVLSISELTINNTDRYAVLCCTIPYANTDELFAKIQTITEFETDKYKTTLFNFYVLFDSIAKNLNFTTVEQGVVSLTIDTSTFVNQKYYMTHLDNSIIKVLDKVDTKTMREVDTSFYLITPNNIEVSNSGQFSKRELNEVYTEYSCALNNQKLSIILSQKVDGQTSPVEDNSFESKLNQFLESKYYNLFIIGCCLFIVIAIIVMMIIAKSYTKVIEKEEKRTFEEKSTHDKDAPKLYWSKDERELENKKKSLLKNQNALVRDCDLDKTESIETAQYKRNSNFREKS